MLLVRRRLAAIIVGAAALAPLATLASGVGAPVALGADGLQFRTASRYVLVPERGVVRVTIDVTLTNLQPDRVRGDVGTRYYYDRISLAAQDESSHLHATDAGRRLTATKAEQQGYDLVTVRLAPTDRRRADTTCLTLRSEESVGYTPATDRHVRRGLASGSVDPGRGRSVRPSVRTRA